MYNLKLNFETGHSTGSGKASVQLIIDRLNEHISLSYKEMQTACFC